MTYSLFSCPEEQRLHSGRRIETKREILSENTESLKDTDTNSATGSKCFWE